MVGLDDREGIFQPECFYDSVKFGEMWLNFSLCILCPGMQYFILFSLVITMKNLFMKKTQTNVYVR